jgi:hypothetical protein
MLGWDYYGFHKNCVVTHYDKVVCFHPARSMGHVLHSGVSMTQNIGTLFLMLGWAQWGFHKMHTQTPDNVLDFLHTVGSASQILHSVVTRP